MRRGHPGIGGWRGDNPRHFRPRSGGTPNFRPPRGFGPIDQPRFPGPRSLLGPRPFHPYPTQNNHSSSEKGRYSYRHSNNQQRSQIQSYGQQRQIFHMLQRIRQGQADTTNSQHDDLSNQYKDNTRYYNNQAKQCHINSMRDVDHRQVNIPQNRELNQQPTVWVNPSAFYEENQNKTFRNYDKEQNKAPLFDYTGHRPPSSDHYGGNLGQTSDKSNTFSRSVDDTVDIVRKRLQRRGSLHALDNNNPPVDQTEENKVGETTSSSYTNVDSQPDQPVKKKVNKTRNVKTNCDKIKTKIVHQLFKMDKDKIHKLMDNPNSSTKFEYAISSLITESQNSYNRHLRSVAEKSLCSSSSEFIHNDNNTIYEDTFMKHMQCILDPQDTVLLEDIKPMVLAELSKVLQLDDFEHRQEYDRQSNFCFSLSEQSHYSQYPSNESCNYENYQNEPYPPEDQSSYYEQKPSLLECPRSETSYASDRHRDYYDEEVESKHLFERRQSRRSRNRSRSRRSSSGGHKHRKDRRSSDSKSNEDKYRHRDPTPDEYRRITTPAPNESITCGSPLPSNSECRSGTPIPLFDTNIEQLSDEDDPFAELDKQYHVAVDHNFIDDDLISQCQIPIIATTSPKVNKEISTTIHTPENPEHPVETSYTVHNAFQIKKAIDTQLHDMAKSPLKFSSRCDEPKKSTYDTKQETATCAEINSKQMVDSDEKSNEPQESSSDFKNTERNADKGKSNTLIKSSTPFRKRSIEEKPSHRKEKRKKSESEEMLTETNKQVLNKNITINVNDCAAKSITEKCDVSKSLFNLFFSKEKSDNNSSKENLKLTTSNKISDRHIKRKEERTSNKSKNKESDNKKHDSISSSHSTLSPTETSVANSSVQTPTKADSKLKTIDMFLDHAKKPSLHQAHRNTAPIAITHSTVVETIKPPVIPSNRKITKKHVSTQVIRKASHKETQTIESKSSTSRFCQTERKRLMTRGMQTEPNYSRSTFKTTDGFERMKEIDMEIQTLLQEKFKLYSSIESKEGCPTNTMQSLGMAVLNVAPLNENDLNDDAVEDAIVDDFTNIPVEELEQIAFETVQEEKGDNAQERRSLRHKVLQRQRTSSLSPATTSSTNTKTKRKAKPPNISLIEQIITDDRPLEDIISLDYLEVLPVPSSKTYKKNKSKSKSKPHKKSTRVVKTSTKTDDYTLKECSVVLVREDLESMLKSIIELNKQSRINDVDETSNIKKSVTELSFKTKQIVEQENVVEETVVSDIQFDMLDVSEDIVIGDSCEVKLSEKDENYTSTGSVNEEIIYDNSQQSIEEAASAKIQDKSRECKVYDFLSDENLRRDSITVLGNADAVLAIEYIENDFIAACLDGNVYYFTGEGQLLSTLRGSNLAVTCLAIVKEKYGTTVYTGSLDSRIRYYDLETGLEKGPECNVLSPIQTMDRAWDTVFVGTRTGFVLQFECKNNMLIPVSTVKFSEQSILALRAMKEGPRKVLLVAARSEPVTIKDAQTGLLLRTLEGPQMTVYTLLFEDGKVYCGTSSHQIHVFEYAVSSFHVFSCCPESMIAYESGSHVGTHDGGKGAVCLRSSGGLLFAGCYDGCVYVYREGDCRALAQLRGPSVMLLSLAVIGSKIIAGYKDRSLYIWKIPLAVLNEMIL